MPNRTTDKRDTVRTEAMAAAIVRRADDGRQTTRRDLLGAGFSACEITRLGDAAVELANRLQARKGRSEQHLDLVA